MNFPRKQQWRHVALASLGIFYLWIQLYSIMMGFRSMTAKSKWTFTESALRAPYRRRTNFDEQLRRLLAESQIGGVCGQPPCSRIIAKGHWPTWVGGVAADAVPRVGGPQTAAEAGWQLLRLDSLAAMQLAGRTALRLGAAPCTSTGGAAGRLVPRFFATPDVINSLPPKSAAWSSGKCCWLPKAIA